MARRKRIRLLQSWMSIVFEKSWATPTQRTLETANLFITRKNAFRTRRFPTVTELKIQSSSAIRSLQEVVLGDKSSAMIRARSEWHYACKIFCMSKNYRPPVYFFLFSTIVWVIFVLVMILLLKCTRDQYVSERFAWAFLLENYALKPIRRLTS